MGTARIAILAIAAIAAGVAAFLVQALLSGGDDVAEVAPTQNNLELTEVLVAARDLGLGQIIGTGDVQWQTWPRTAVTESYIGKDGASDAIETTLGATVRQSMLAGEPVTTGKVVRSENAGFMAAMLNPGKRAVSVRISAETGAGGFILPNDRVDVILTHRDAGSGGGNEHSSETILANIRVLAIDQTFREEGDKRVVVGKTATLELSSGQAENLTRAEASGTVSLVLRSLADFDANRDSDGDLGVNAPVTVLRYGTSSRVTVSGAAE